MFENNTQSAIQSRILARIPDKYDKREGSLLQTLVGPIAAELYQAYADMDSLLDETYAASASYSYLVRRCYDRGILPIAGQPAVLLVYTTPDAMLSEGNQLTMGTLTYTVTAWTWNDGTQRTEYSLTCDTAGTDGNQTEGDVIPMPDIPGLEAVTLIKVKVYGTDDEAEDHLYQRYLASFAGGPCGGNIAWYKNLIGSYDVVRGVRVRALSHTATFIGEHTCNVHAYTLWTTSSGKVSREIPIQGAVTPTGFTNILAVQFGLAEDGLSFKPLPDPGLDPDQDGKGSGQIPIGHVLNLREATILKTDISGTVTLREGYAESDVSEAISDILDGLQEAWADLWRDTDEVIRVTATDIQSAISKVDGVASVTVTVTQTNTAEDPTDELESEPKFQFPVLGEVSLTYAEPE